MINNFCLALLNIIGNLYLILINSTDTIDGAGVYGVRARVYRRSCVVGGASVYGVGASVHGNKLGVDPVSIV